MWSHILSNPIINVEMADTFTPESISRVFFTQGEDLLDGREQWECRECQKMDPRQKRAGWSNLAQHAKKHEDWANKVKAALRGGGPIDSYVQKKVYPEASNVFRWLEWIIMNDHPFSFVEKSLTRKNCNLKPISRNSIVKYLDALVRQVEQKAS